MFTAGLFPLKPVMLLMPCHMLLAFIGVELFFNFVFVLPFGGFDGSPEIVTGLFSLLIGEGMSQVKDLHFRAYSFFVEGTLDWRMVSTTSVERPKAMSCAPSGATPTVSTTSGGKDHALRLWEEIPPDGNLQWRTAEERNQLQEPYSARPEWGY